jgi:hypothetical protein
MVLKEINYFRLRITAVEYKLGKIYAVWSDEIKRITWKTPFCFPLLVNLQLGQIYKNLFTLILNIKYYNSVST